jgi:anti-sigma regulatory factor (Ser/Thr protein kinase)/anti-anti-sigma regulatory factor
MHCMATRKENLVERYGNFIKFHTLNSSFVPGEFIRAIYHGQKDGYTDFRLDFKEVESVYPNTCVPLAGLLEYYRSTGLQFNCENETSFLEKTRTLRPTDIQSSNSNCVSPLDIVWRFSSSEEVYSIVSSYVEAVERAVVCKDGVIQGLEWCLNETMDNVLQHANAKCGYVMGQIHNNSKHIAICIYDYGQGIFNTLQNSEYKYTLRTAVDAITIALEEGVTRDKKVGQGNGLWGLNNIVRSNSGLLNITSGRGYLGIDSDGKPKTSNSQTFLSKENGCTTIDFQIDFDRVISLPEALGGHQPVNIRLENIEDDSNNINLQLSKEKSGTGTRQSGISIRTKVMNISNQTNSIIILDFSGISVISSSFADEFIGKLVNEFGFTGFVERFRLVGMNETVKAITNRSVAQRISFSKE